MNPFASDWPMMYGGSIGDWTRSAFKRGKNRALPSGTKTSRTVVPPQFLARNQAGAC